MRLLHVKAQMDLRLGGSVRAVISICQAAQAVGEECDVVATTARKGRAPTRRAVDYEGVRVYEFPRCFPSRFGNSWALYMWLRANLRQYDLVEIHEVFSLASLLASHTSRRAGVPYVIRPHGSLDPFDLRKHHAIKRLIAPLLRRLLLAGGQAIWLTSRLEEDRVEMFGADTATVSTPLPVPQQGQQGDGHSFRRRHNISNDSFVVLFLSRIDYKKGLERILAAIVELQARGHDLTLVIAGTGEKTYVASVKLLCLKLGVHANTRFVGFVAGPEKDDCFAAADVFILPSDNENFGIAPIEALYANCPVIVSENVYIAHELASHGAALVIPATTKGVTDSLEAIYTDARLRESLRVRGRAAAHRLYDPVVVGRAEQAMRLRIAERSSREVASYE